VTTTADNDQRRWRRASNDAAYRERRDGRRGANQSSVSAFASAVFSVGVVPNKPMVPTAPTRPLPTRRARCGGTSASRWAARRRSQAELATRSRHGSSA